MTKRRNKRLCLFFLLSLVVVLMVSGIAYAESWARVKAAEREISTIEDDWFYPYQTFEVLGWTAAVGAGDFNHDGRTDVAVTNSGSAKATGELIIFLQSPIGTLQSSVIYVTGYRPDSLVVGDFNDDGWDDIVVAQFSGDIAVFLQEADGTLTEAITYSTNSQQPDAIAAGDFNNDGRQDVAVSLFAADHIGLFYQDAGGTLLPMTTEPARWTGIHDMAAGDFNHDGRLDIAQSHGGAGEVGPSLSLFMQEEAGGFTRSDMGPEEIVQNMAVGDLNGDGWDDIAVSYLYAWRLEVYQQTAGGTMAPPVNYTAAAGSVVIGDVTEDGLNDLLLAELGMGKLALFVQQQDATLAFQEHYPYPFNSSYLSAATAIGDVNGDGRPDVLSANQNYSLAIHYHSVPDFALTLSPSSIILQPGQSITYTTTISRLYNYSGTVTLSMSALPPGATHNLPAGPFSPTASFAFAVNLDPATPISLTPYPVTITASDGTITRTGEATITVLNQVYLPAVYKP